METPPKTVLLLTLFLASSAAVCLAGRGGLPQQKPYKPQTIFQNADNDPAAGMSSFIPGDGYGMGPFIGAVPLVGFVPATPRNIEASFSQGPPSGGGKIPAAQDPASATPATGGASVASLRGLPSEGAPTVAGTGGGRKGGGE